MVASVLLCFTRFVWNHQLQRLKHSICSVNFKECICGTENYRKSGRRAEQPFSGSYQKLADRLTRTVDSLGCQSASWDACTRENYVSTWCQLEHSTNFSCTTSFTRFIQVHRVYILQRFYEDYLYHIRITYVIWWWYKNLNEKLTLIRKIVFFTYVRIDWVTLSTVGSVTTGRGVWVGTVSSSSSTEHEFRQIGKSCRLNFMVRLGNISIIEGSNFGLITVVLLLSTWIIVWPNLW